MSQVCVRKKEGQIIFLVEWKGTCTFSTLAGCRLIFISSHTHDSSERREQWLADENVLVPLQLSANSYVALWSLISDESGVWGKRGTDYFCHAQNIFDWKLLLKQQCNKIASILTVRTYDLSYKLISTKDRTCCIPHCKVLKGSVKKRECRSRVSTFF